MEKLPIVYVLASQRNGTLYVGVTSNIQRRLWLHSNDKLPGFTCEYQVHRLVYYEVHGSMMSAIEREKQLKHWRPDLEGTAHRGAQSGMVGSLAHSWLVTELRSSFVILA
jgi:putative endonuclease